MPCHAKTLLDPLHLTEFHKKLLGKILRKFLNRRTDGPKFIGPGWQQPGDQQ